MRTTPISIARHRATLAKRTLAFGSVLAFAVTFGLARSSDPVHATSSASGSVAADQNQTPVGSQGGQDSASGGFGQADVGPSTSQAPSVSTGAS